MYAGCAQLAMQHGTLASQFTTGMLQPYSQLYRLLPGHSTTGSIGDGCCCNLAQAAGLVSGHFSCEPVYMTAGQLCRRDPFCTNLISVLLGMASVQAAVHCLAVLPCAFARMRALTTGLRDNLRITKHICTPLT